MTRLNKRMWWFLLIAILPTVLLMTACQNQRTDSVLDESNDPQQIIPTEVAPEESAACGEDEQVEIRWFVGLGTGLELEQRNVENEIAAQFNALNDECITLLIEYVDNASAPQVLRQRIATGTAPDIIGPVGIAGRTAFQDELLVLNNQTITAFDAFNMGDFNPKLLDLFNIENGQVALPFAVFPSLLFVNLELFEEAGLNPPPQVYGDSYELDGERLPWDVNTLREVAMRLTLDRAENNVLNPDFDPDRIVQWGYGNQWHGDVRGSFSVFGGARFYRGNGEGGMSYEAIVPEKWRTAANWYHDAMWVDHFYPNHSQRNQFKDGNWFASEKVAMVQTHLWYIGSFDMDDFDWSVGVVPASVDGNITAKVHSDTFSILKHTKHPDKAFEVIRFLIGDDDLLDGKMDGDPAVETWATELLLPVIGGTPARISLQDAYFVQLGRGEINQDTIMDGLDYPDIPSHEGFMPNYEESLQSLLKFEERLNSEPDLNVNEALSDLQTQLQSSYDAEQ